MARATSARSRSRRSRKQATTVVVLDDLSTGHRSAVPDGAALEVGTYADGAFLAALLERHRIEAILHCAARSLVGESGRRPGALLHRQRRGRRRPARSRPLGRRQPPRLQLQCRRLRRAGDDADPRGCPAPADQHVRRDQADVRGRDGRVRSRLRAPLGEPPLLQRRRARRSGSARTTTRRRTSSRTSSLRWPAPARR